jgi:hypothetical protein
MSKPRVDQRGGRHARRFDMLGHACLPGWDLRGRLLLCRWLLGKGGSHQHGYDGDGDERFHW